MRVYGKNVVKELLQKPKSIKKAYIYENFNDIKLLNEIKKLNIPIKYLDKKSLDNMEDGNHQGIILEIDDYNYSPLDKLLKKDIIVILDHLEDPHNFGAIIRTCEAAGITSIIIPKDRSVKVNSTVMKTSAGTTENVDIAIVTNLVNTIKTLKDNGFWIIGTDMNGTNYKEIDYKGKAYYAYRKRHEKAVFGTDRADRGRVGCYIKRLSELSCSRKHIGQRRHKLKRGDINGKT